MSRQRFDAIAESRKRDRMNVGENGRRSELFATNVFNSEKMLQ